MIRVTQWIALRRTVLADPNDPKRGGQFFAYRAQYRGGGNPALLPEESRSWSAGAIYTPTALPGLRLTLDYTRIRKTGEIAGLATQEILDHEEAFSDRITRASEKTAQRSGMNLMVFTDEEAALAWLRG